MEYQILERKNSQGEIFGLELNMSPENYPLSSLMWCLKKEQFPYYINEIFENRSIGVENASFVFYEEMDWEDKEEFCKNFNREVIADEMRISFYDGIANYSVMKRKDFLKIFYDYSSKLLKISSSNKSLSENWEIEMKLGLEKLKSRIEDEPSDDDSEVDLEF